MPGVAFPPVGRVGGTSPPSLVLCAAQTATLPLSGRFACRSRPDTLPASVCSWCPVRARARVEAPRARRGFLSPGPPFRECDKETGGSPTFPSYPYAYMPRSETPVVSPPLAKARLGLLPSGHWKPSAFLSLLPGEISFCPRLYTFRGAITRPASSLLPASYGPLRGGTRVRY
jgi:hypothetical protein